MLGSWFFPLPLTGYTIQRHKLYFTLLYSATFSKFIPHYELSFHLFVNCLCVRFPATEHDQPDKRHRRAAGVTSDETWQHARQQAAAFFRQLDEADLKRDRDNYVRLPIHPSLRMGAASRFNTSSGFIELLHREMAEQFQAEALERCKDDQHNYLYIQGAQGVGKSHSLYEAV